MDGYQELGTCCIINKSRTVTKLDLSLEVQTEIVLEKNLIKKIFVRMGRQLALNNSCITLIATA